MDAFALKLIAIFAMFIDHFGATFEPVYNTQALRVIGRLSFPIFAFLIAEGCKHTHNITKYALRLLLFAFISEIPFDVLFNTIDIFPSKQIEFLSFEHQNVFFTMFFAVVLIMVYNFAKRQTQMARRNALYILCFILYSQMGIASADYGKMGVLIIFLCYVLKQRKHQLLALAAFVVILYGGASTYSLFLMGGGLLSVLLIYFYNGERGLRAKWLFYAFYPVHLAIMFVMYEMYLRYLM